MKNKFVQKSIKTHGNKYDYSKVEYINSKIKVKIICHIHGEFEQTPSKHLMGRGCLECFKDRRYLTKDKFVQKSIKTHGNKYDYSKVEYINNKTKVKIICEYHGEFKQNPKEHINGQGCRLCYNEKIRYNHDILYHDFNEIHKNKYDYSLMEYKNMITKIKIICSIHGEFEQNPKNHKEGKGCPKCGADRIKLSIGDFKKRSDILHNDKYNYDKVIFDNTKDKSIIICPIHGEFNQEINSHLNGSGCRKCSSSKGEKLIREWLESNDIKYLEQHSFDDCIHKSKLKFDFYLPESNTIIEYDGIQHFKPIDYFGGYLGFKETKKRDYIKNEYCEVNKINLVRIPYFEKISLNLQATH